MSELSKVRPLFTVSERWYRLFEGNVGLPDFSQILVRDLFNIGLFLSEYQTPYPFFRGTKHVLGLFIYSNPLKDTTRYVDPYCMILMHIPSRQRYLFCDNGFGYITRADWMEEELTPEERKDIQQEIIDITKSWELEHKSGVVEWCCRVVL